MKISSKASVGFDDFQGALAEVKVVVTALHICHDIKFCRNQLSNRYPDFSLRSLPSQLQRAKPGEVLRDHQIS